MSTAVPASIENLKLKAIQAMSDGNSHEFINTCKDIAEITSNEIITLAGQIKRTNLNPAHYVSFAKSCGINFNLTYSN